MKQPGKHKDQILDQFTQQAEGYARLTAGLPPRTAGDDLAAFDPRPDDHALDVACGSGNLAIPLAARVARVTGIDLTPAMIDQGRARQAAQGIDNIEWILGDVDPLPFADGSFSLVTCSAAFHHFEHPARVFREMVRVCRPGGRIAVKDFAFPPEKTAAFDTVERLRDPSHVHAHTLAELRALATGSGAVEHLVQPHRTPVLPLEAILATSFPGEGLIEKVRDAYRSDAESGQDALGLGTHERDGALRISYPMATLVWIK